MILLNSRTRLVNIFIKSGKSIIEFIKHVYISWVVLKLKLASGRFPFPYRNPFYHVMCSAQHSCYSHGMWIFQLIHRSHPCEIRQYSLSLCLYPLLVSSSLLPTRCYWYFWHAFAILLWFIYLLVVPSLHRSP